MLFFLFEANQLVEQIALVSKFLAVPYKINSLGTFSRLFWHQVRNSTSPHPSWARHKGEGGGMESNNSWECASNYSL